MSDEFGWIMIGALIFILCIVYVFLPDNDGGMIGTMSDYHSETKAYREDGKMCDYYLEYQGQKLVNRTLLGCV